MSLIVIFIQFLSILGLILIPAFIIIDVWIFITLKKEKKLLNNNQVNESKINS